LLSSSSDACIARSLLTLYYRQLYPPDYKLQIGDTFLGVHHVIVLARCPSLLNQSVQRTLISLPVTPRAAKMFVHYLYGLELPPAENSVYPEEVDITLNNVHIIKLLVQCYVRITTTTRLLLS